MIDLQNIKLCSLLPPNIQDAKTRALGAAWDLQYRKLIQMRFAQAWCLLL